MDLLGLSRLQAGQGQTGRRTSLGLRIAMGIAVIFLLCGIAQFFVVREITRRQFHTIERNNLVDRTRQVFLTFQREATHLQTITSSTGAWRDTYDFAEKPDPGYLERTFGGNWPEIYHTDFVLMVDANGRRIWSSDGYASFAHAMPRRFDQAHFKPGDPFIFPRTGALKPTSTFVGLVGEGERIWLYCAQAITNDDMTAEPRGVLLLGRIIDKASLSSYTFARGDVLELAPLSAVPPEGRADDVSIAREFSGYWLTRTAIKNEGNSLVSYTVFSDSGGTPLAALRLAIPRDIEAAGSRLVGYMSISLFCIALVSLAAILFTVRTAVIRPVERLASFFTAQAEGREEPLRVSTRRGDEIGFLAEQAEALVTKVKKQNAELEDQANTDRLTGLANRRSFEIHVSKELCRLVRAKRGNPNAGSLAVVVVDVDHFKLFNDTNGHLAGDVCLRTIADSIRSRICRTGDLACRFGGEEFIIVLPGTHEAGALVVAEAVRAGIERLAIPHPASPVSAYVTVSVGAAAAEIGDAFAIEPLIERADQALYAAKRAGRNRIVAGSSLV